MSKPVELVLLLMTKSVQPVVMLPMIPEQFVPLLMLKSVPASTLPVPQLYSPSAGWCQTAASHVYPACRVVLITA